MRFSSLFVLLASIVLIASSAPCCVAQVSVDFSPLQVHYDDDGEEVDPDSEEDPVNYYVPKDVKNIFIGTHFFIRDKPGKYLVTITRTARNEGAFEETEMSKETSPALVSSKKDATVQVNERVNWKDMQEKYDVVMISIVVTDRKGAVVGRWGYRFY